MPNSTTYNRILSKGIEAELPKISDGKLRFTTDTGRLFLDNGSSRVEISDFIKGKTAEEITGLLAPLPKFYLASDTNILYFYAGGAWNTIKALNASTADYAGNAINTITRSSNTFTATRFNGSTFTFAQKDTTYSVVTTAANGLAPKVTNTSGFLKGDGTWAVPGDTKYAAGEGLDLNSGTFSIDKDASTVKYATSAGSATNATCATNASSVNGFTVGKSVPADAKFTDNDTTYTNGEGLSLSNGTFSINKNASTVKYATSAGSATNADSATNSSTADYANSAADGIDTITRSNLTFTVKRKDGSSFTFTQKDDNTTYGNVTSATAGLAPAGGSGTTKYLRQDGSWQVPPNDNTTYGAGTGLSLGTDNKFSINKDASTVKYATSAGSANSASSATNATSATYATNAGSATNSSTAEYATTAANGIDTITRDGLTFTATRQDGSTFTFTQQDNNTTYPVVSTTGNGLAPKVTDTSKFLKGDGTWATPTNTTYANATTDNPGLLPTLDGSTNKYLNGNGQWTIPPNDNTTYGNVTSATAGLAPAGGSGTTKYLRQDGSWQVPPNTTYANVTSAAAGLAPAGGSGTTKYLRQDGSWQVPPNNDTTYAGGEGLNLDGGTFSIDKLASTVAYATNSGNADLATSATNASSVNGFTVGVSVPANAKFTDTTYAAFSTATDGLVKKPTNATTMRFLRGDNTWVVPTNTTYAAGTGLSLSNGTFSINQGASTVAYATSAGLADNATSATNSSTSEYATTAANGIDTITRSGLTFTAKRTDGSSFTFTQQDNNTTYGNVTSAAAGLAPAGGSGTTKYLRQDGSWQVPPNTTYAAGTGLSLSNGTFSINKSASTVAYATNAGSATNSSTSDYATTAANGIDTITRDGLTFTATRQDGSTFIFTQQDNNTTYGAGTGLSLGADNKFSINKSASTVAYATSAGSANSASSATNSSTAEYATNAGSADNATSATNASTADYANSAADGIDTITRSNLTFTVKRKDGSSFTFTQKDDNTTYGNVTSAAAGLAPAGGSGTTKYLRQDGSWQVPPNDNTTYGVVSTAGNGLAPKVTSTSGFLKGDGTWATPTNTTYAVVSTTGNGLAPKVTDTSKFLKGDGTWATPTNTTYANVTSAAAGLAPAGGSGTTKYLRQDGSWQVPPNTTYAAGTGLSLSNGTFSIDQSASSAAYATNAGSATNSSTADYATNADTANFATSATNSSTADYAGNAINTITRSSNTFTATRFNGSTFTFTQQNTTYGLFSTKANGLVAKPTNATTAQFLRGNNTWGMPTASEVGAIPATDKGAVNGVAELDANGKVPSEQLPSYVDDVIEGYYYNNKFYEESTHTTEIPGESGKIYVDLNTNKTYRWGGSAFVVISETLALGETSSTAYRGDRGKIAYDHSQAAHAPSNAQPNQNAFSNIVVDSTTVAADTPTDTLTFVAGDNVTITPDATNDKVTIASANTTYGNVTSAAAGLAPAGGSGTTKYLRQDGSWQVPPNTTYANVTSAAAGLAPAGGSGTTKYLRQDGSWQVPPNTTYAVVSTTANGLAPKVTDTSKFLKGDGTWATPTNTTYAAGTGLSLSNGTFSIDQSASSVSYATNAGSADNATCATNSSSVGGFTVGVSVPANAKFTDTTYATFSTAANGLVPKPTNATTAQFLRGNGTWATPTNTTYANVTSATAGLAPAGGSGTTKYLRQDGSWQVPPNDNTTYANVTSAAAGLAPAGGSGTTKYLRQDGSWQVPPNTTYAAGTGLSLSNGTFSIDQSASSVSYATNAGTADYSTNSSTSEYATTAANGIDTITRSGNTYTVKRQDGSSFTFTQKDDNTTYAAMSVAEGQAGTATTSRAMTAKNLKDILASSTVAYATNSSTAEYATTAANGIDTITRDGLTFTATRQDGSTFTFTQQDNNTTYPVVSTTGNGLAPKVTDTSKFLKGDGTWATPTNTTYATFSTAANGLVPKPTNATTAQFLRGNGTWATPTNTTYAVVSTTGNGLAPTLPNDTTKYLNGTGQWTVPPNDNTTYGNVTSAAAGLAPAGGSGTTKYLRQDGSWQVPPNTTYANVTSAAAGLAPAGGSGTTKYLRQDGSWQVPPNDNTTYADMTTVEYDAGTSTTTRVLSPKRLKEIITSGSVSYATNAGTADYATSAGNAASVGGFTVGVSVPSNAKFTDTTYATFSTAANGLVPKPTNATTAQFLRGNGTWATPTNTTYATFSTAANGLVPKPTNATTAQFLKGNGTWATPTNTTYANATTDNPGLLPKLDGSTLHYLRGDGTWVTPPNDNTTYDLSNYVNNITTSGTGDFLTGVTKTGNGATLSKASLTKSQVTTALGYTPPTSNTTYADMTTAEYNTGTSTTTRVLSPKRLKDIITGAATSYATNAGTANYASSASTASRLANTAKVGDTNKPVYFKADGTPAAISYTIGTSVPSGAVFTDTKVTAGSTDTSSKIFLIGATSQAANPQTYSDNEVFTTDGVLTAKSVQVGGGSVTLQYNTVTQSLDFVFA